MTSRNITTVRTKWTLQDKKNPNAPPCVRFLLCPIHTTLCWLSYRDMLTTHWVTLLVSSPISLSVFMCGSLSCHESQFFELHECTLYYNGKEDIHQIHKIWRYIIHIYYTILYYTILYYTTLYYTIHYIHGLLQSRPCTAGYSFIG